MNLVVGLHIYAVVLIGLSPGLVGRGPFPEGRGIVIIVAILFNWKCSALNFPVLDKTNASYSQMKLKSSSIPKPRLLAQEILHEFIYIAL
jgi:hypothetical protein